VIGLAAAAITLVAAAAPVPAPVTGRWATEDGTAVVHIAPCGKALCGRIAKVLKAKPGQATTDVHNPDAAKRGRPIIGLTILTGLKASASSWDGQIYDPKTGRSYTAYLSIDGNRLAMKGCYGVFCKTQYWTRAQ
jgi:uncharacterized protein (DUF2147 family)